jgi:hypothetical protein
VEGKIFAIKVSGITVAGSQDDTVRTIEAAISDKLDKFLGEINSATTAWAEVREAHYPSVTGKGDHR